MRDGKTHVLVEAEEVAAAVGGGATNSGSSMVALLRRKRGRKGRGQLISSKAKRDLRADANSHVLSLKSVRSIGSLEPELIPNQANTERRRIEESHSA